MAGISFGRSIGDIDFTVAEKLQAFRDLPAEAQYRSGATNHETFFQLQDYPAEALYHSGATNHEVLFSLTGYAAEALHASGATAHDTSGFSVNSPYVCPEEGSGVFANYTV